MPVTLIVTSPAGLKYTTNFLSNEHPSLFGYYLIVILLAITDPFVILIIVWFKIDINVGTPGDVTLV